jgi:hypothetical protein
MLIQEKDIPIVNNITLNRWENKICRCLNAFLISGASIFKRSEYIAPYRKLKSVAVLFKLVSRRNLLLLF